MSVLSLISGTLLIPIPDLQSFRRMQIADVISRKYGRSCDRILNHRGHHNMQATSIGRLYIRIRAYLVKVHRTSDARTRFSRPIIKMHARYVTMLCTYVPKYYPTPVPALSFSLFFSLDAKYTKRI